ncbi:MAG: hypothetical protein WC467_01790 [Patescibacteria group bacterium]
MKRNLSIVENNDDQASGTELEVRAPSFLRKTFGIIRSRISFIPGFNPAKLSLEEEPQLEMDIN